MNGYFNLLTKKMECSTLKHSCTNKVIVCHEGRLWDNSDESADSTLNKIGRTYRENETFNQLRGAFLFAIHDQDENRYLLVRDHFGVLPLYYTIQLDMVVFGTTINTILKTCRKYPELNVDLIPEYFVFKYISGKNTLYKDIHEVPPGSIVEFNKNKSPKINYYYDFNYRKNEAIDSEEASRLFHKIFLDGFSSLISDNKEKRIGVLSSGGIDSSILVSLGSRYLIPRFNTYYVGTEGYEHNRTHMVNVLSRLHETTHMDVIIPCNVFSNNLINTIRINEEPLNHPSTVLRSCLYSQINHEVDVLLSGEGADCFFCGYYIFDILKISYQFNFARELTKQVSSYFPLKIIPTSYRSKIKRILDSFIIDPDDFAIFNDILACNSIKTIESLLDLPIIGSIGKNYKLILHGFTKSNIMDKILNIYQTYYIIEALNTIAKLGFKYNLEHRHPFIDVDLVDLFNSFPWKEKIKLFSRKHHVVELAKKYLPEDFFKKRKEGFGVPLKQWFHDKNGLGRYIALLVDKKTRERGIFKKKYLDSLLDTYHKQSLPDDSYESLLWPIINFELWIREYFDWDNRGYE